MNSDREPGWGTLTLTGLLVGLGSFLGLVYTAFSVVETVASKLVILGCAVLVAAALVLLLKIKPGRTARLSLLSLIILISLAVTVFVAVQGSPNSGTTENTNPSSTPSSGSSPSLESGDVAQLRVPQSAGQWIDPAPIDDGDGLSLRLRLRNITGIPIRSLRARIQSRKNGEVGITEVFVEDNSGSAILSDTATVNLSHASLQPVWDATSARLTDANGGSIEILPSGILQGGVAIGDLAPGEERLLIIDGTADSYREEAVPQIQGSPVEGRVLGGEQELHRNAIAVSEGDLLQVVVLLHNGDSAVDDVRLTARIDNKPKGSSGIKIVTRSKLTEPAETAFSYLVNFQGGKDLLLIPKYGTTEVYTVYGHSSDCPAPTGWKQLEEGLFQGGVYLPPIGHPHDKGDCDETTLFVQFVVRAVR